MRKGIFTIVIITALLGLMIGGWVFIGHKISEKEAKKANTTKYYCPMHPTYISNKPGDCPICNMKLVPMKENAEHVEHGETDSEKDKTMDRVSIVVSPEKQGKIGVQFTRVETRELLDKVTFTAVVEHDETRYVQIAPRFGGWIRKLHVNFTGQNVEKGETLMSVYSPEVFNASSEYLLALERFEQVKTIPESPQYVSSKQIVESALRRLGLLEITHDGIQKIEKERKPLEEVVIRSPVKGHVISKTAVEGKYFMPGETLYEIGDLSRLWIRAFVYERDINFIRTNQKCRIILPYMGNKEFDGIVSFIYPHINEATRRAEVRIEVENPDEQLRPGMWASVEAEIKYGKTLVVPAACVIDSGRRFIAFARGSDESLEPRELKIGIKTDNYYQVLDGLKEGEEVVLGALFLIDSESQLKAAMSSMSKRQH